MNKIIVKQSGHRVIVRFMSSMVSDSEIKEYLQKIGQVFERGEPFILLYDCTLLTWLSSSQIKLQTNFMKDIQDKQPVVLTERIAIILPSLAARAILKTIFQICKPRCTVGVFSNTKSGKDFLRKSQLSSQKLE